MVFYFLNPSVHSVQPDTHLNATLASSYYTCCFPKEAVSSSDKAAGLSVFSMYSEKNAFRFIKTVLNQADPVNTAT